MLGTTTLLINNLNYQKPKQVYKTYTLQVKLFDHEIHLKI